MRDTGFPDPDQDPYRQDDVQHGTLRLRVACLSHPDRARVARHITRCRALIAANPDLPLLIDLRGNPGGDFTLALPLVEVCAETWKGPRLTLLVDKFTFSAAIVTAFLIADACPGRTRYLGEPMGDGRQFWAEGGERHFDAARVILRHSDVFHDWRDGIAGPEVPASFARYMRAVGRPDITPGGEITETDLRQGRDPWMERALALQSPST